MKELRPRWLFFSLLGLVFILLVYIFFSRGPEDENKAEEITKKVERVVDSIEVKNSQLIDSIEAIRKEVEQLKNQDNEIKKETQRNLRNIKTLFDSGLNDAQRDSIIRAILNS